MSGFSVAEGFDSDASIVFFLGSVGVDDSRGLGTASNVGRLSGADGRVIGAGAFCGAGVGGCCGSGTGAVATGFSGSVFSERGYIGWEKGLSVGRVSLLTGVPGDSFFGSGFS